MSARGRTRKEVLSLIGDPKQVARDLQRFRKNTRTVESTHPKLVDTYPDKWVAVYEGKVRAHSTTFSSLMVAMERQGLPRKDVIVRYIDREERILIV